MASTRLEEIPDTACGVLAGLRVEREVLAAAEVRKLRLVLAWAVMHSTDTLIGPPSEWSEHAMPMGGPGAPEVAEFCVPELAVALQVSHDSAAGYLGHAVELAYRLPRVYARVLAGGLSVWKARRIAESTLCLPLEGAGFIDAHVAHVSATIGFAALDRLIEEAQVRFDPEEAELRRLAKAEARCFDIHLTNAGHDGTVVVEGTLELADALDLEAAVSAGARDLAVLGSTDILGVRRSAALGVLARHQLTLDLNPPDTDGPAQNEGKRVKARQVVIHVHLADHAVARVEELSAAGGCLSVAQVAEWCTNRDTHVLITPVIDLNAVPHTNAYEIPDRIRDHVVLRDPTCVFPQCTRNARRCDLDHLTPWAEGGEGGQTTPANLAPLCRRHHRLKTHGHWSYTRNPDGTYHWTSPHTRHREV